MKLQAPRGTDDIFIEDARLWQYVEDMAKEVFEIANF